MYRACIAVVDASRARLFTFERSTDEQGLHEQFTEQKDLINPGRRLRPSELFSDSRPGSSRTGSLQYAFDDHRSAHIEAMDTAFSRSIMSELSELVAASHAQKVILCASSSMLGELRATRGKTTDVETAEIARDLVKLTPSELREHLASYGLLR